MFIGLAALAGPPAAQAEDTVWICKPGQADDLCAGSITATAGTPAQTIGFNRPEKAPVDCFYIYPTVSEQDTPNANLNKDPEVQRVVVQQARMFSRVCDVYAPMYRQDTSPGVYTERTEVAYQSALSGWKDYLANYNKGRGVILLGHSQGSATVARLIDEEVDPNPALRKQLVGAILPGGNIYVKKGQTTGGMFANVPTCTKVGEYGCLVAFSMFNGTPNDNPPFGDLGSGYWAYKMDRPSSDEYEVICTDPAQFSGAAELTSLVNMDYLLSPPSGGIEVANWKGFPDAVHSSCKRDGTKHWLDVEFNEGADPFLKGMIPIVASGKNWHVPEVNVAENNLVQIAQLQTDSYMAEQGRIAGIKAKLKSAKSKLNKAQRRLSMTPTTVRDKARRAAKAKGPRKKALLNQIKSLKKRAANDRRQVKSLKKQIASLERQIG